MDMPNARIIGGSSGLGLKLRLLLTGEYQVLLAGRKDPKSAGLSFILSDLDRNDRSLGEQLGNLLEGSPRVDMVVYAAGFRQEGRLEELTD